MCGLQHPRCCNLIGGSSPSGQLTERWIIWTNAGLFIASLGTNVLTHWGRVTHKCVSNLTIIGSDNGLSPDRRQAIIWTNAGLLLIGPLGTNFSEILIEILTFSFKKMRLKVSFAKRLPFCFGLNVLIRRNMWSFICTLSANDKIKLFYQ